MHIIINMKTENELLVTVDYSNKPKKNYYNIVMVLYSRFIWITNSSDHRRV